MDLIRLGYDCRQGLFDFNLEVMERNGSMARLVKHLSKIGSATGGG